MQDNISINQLVQGSVKNTKTPIVKTNLGNKVVMDCIARNMEYRKEKSNQEGGEEVIIHNCMKCDYHELIPLAPGQLPKFEKYVCPECKTTQWIKHSRIDPSTYSEDSVEVDEEKKTIKLLRKE
jgi:hypothetical protein